MWLKNTLVYGFWLNLAAWTGWLVGARTENEFVALNAILLFQLIFFLAFWIIAAIRASIVTRRYFSALAHLAMFFVICGAWNFVNTLSYEHQIRVLDKIVGIKQVSR